MDLLAPPAALASLASFVRDRLADVGGTLAPMIVRRDEVAVSGPVATTARQVATVIIAAAAPFAPTSYSRARLIRQMHASGLLSPDEAMRAEAVLELGVGASR